MNAARADNSSSVVTYGLQTEQRSEAFVVDDPQPRLSWKVRSDRRGAYQSAYRITAALRAEDLEIPNRLLWDGGRRESTETLLVPWKGPALQSATRYHWRVEVWDEAGVPGEPAQTWFETGLLHGSDWQANWLGRDPHNPPHVDPPRMRAHSPLDHAQPPLNLRREFTSHCN